MLTAQEIQLIISLLERITRALESIEKQAAAEKRARIV